MRRRYRSGNKSFVLAAGILVLLSACAGVPVSMPGMGELPGEPDPTSDPKVAAAARGFLPLDITGDASLSAERDRLSDLLRPLLDFDGGMIWDPASNVLAIQMTSNAAINQARRIIAESGTSLHITFVRVQYSAQELDDLSNQLLGDQLRWAGATGIGGGYDPRSNRVLLQVDPGYRDASTLMSAIEKLKDPRVSLQLIEPVDGWEPEAPDPADKAASAVVDPVERAEHDAILDLPLKDEIRAVEQPLLQLGVLTEFPDAFGATEIDDAARFLVFYNDHAAPDRVAAFLQRIDAVDAPVELTVVAVPAGYAAAERQLVLRELLRPGADLAAELGVSRLTGGGIDHRTGQILIHTSDEIIGRTVTIDGETIRLVGSTSPAITGFTSDASTFLG